ncbi:hypothetical protein GGI18_003940, partial [Coemansia linderi]
MRAQSLFQILPTLVVELIVDYVAAHRQKVSSLEPLEVGAEHEAKFIYPSAIERVKLQLPLLWVCSSFRAVVYANCCKCCTVRFIGSQCNKRVVISNTWPGRFKNLDIPVHLLARELKIEVSLRDIYSGKALSVMLPRCNLAHEFPRVCVLQFWITSVRVDLDITRSSLGVQQNISAFATHIKKMLPRIHKISVS